MYSIKRYLIPLTVLTLCGSAVGFAAQEDALDTAIERGLAWILAHPATCEDGGFLDLIDEGLFYLTVRRLDPADGHADRRELAFADCLSRLEASPEFQRQLALPDKTLIQHYHLLLATHLIETVKGPTAGRERVISDAQRTLAENTHAHPTFRLTVALLLRHLGATPSVSLDQLFDASLLNHLPQAAAPSPLGTVPGLTRLRHPLFYYALVHEVAASTDFGRLPPSPWLAQRRDRVGQMLQEGARLALATRHVDLLAELLLCNQMLDLPVTGALLHGIDFLVANQRTDGSWGEQPTPRASRVRHAVQTATTALIAHKTAMQAN